AETTPTRDRSNGGLPAFFKPVTTLGSRGPNRNCHAESHPLSRGHRNHRRHRLRRVMGARAFCPTASARDVGHDPAGKAREVRPRETSRSARDESFIELFLDMLAAERGASRNTLDAYRRDLGNYAEFLHANDSGIARASTDELRNYLAALAKRGMAPNSSARRLSAIRQLHRFLYAEGKRGDDPAAVLEGPRRGRPLPKILSVEEVTRLFDAAHDAAHAKEITPAEKLRAARLVCVLEVLYASGLRVSELIVLPASAARSESEAITVRGKGNKERLVPLGKTARKAMRDYLKLISESK